MVTRKVLMMVALVAGLAATDSPSYAHHGNAAFEVGTPTELKNAVVTEYNWSNPHPLINAYYKDEKVNDPKWIMEMGSTVTAQLIGWTRNTGAPG
jgi:hypothetical protein